MPTYQYACTACGHRFEAVQSFSDATLSECPECAGRVRKVFSSVGIVFKGSGFYRTDSRSGARVDATSSSGSPDKSGAKSSSGDSAPTTSSPAASSTTSSNGNSAKSSTGTTAKAS